MADENSKSQIESLKKLADAVHKHSLIFDKQHEMYYDNPARDLAWKEISKETGRSATDCHKRWKLMREKFVKELKKYEFARKRGELFQSDWACFENILFLRDHIIPRNRNFKNGALNPLLHSVRSNLSLPILYERALESSYAEAPPKKRVRNSNPMPLSSAMDLSDDNTSVSDSIKQEPSNASTKAESDSSMAVALLGDPQREEDTDRAVVKHLISEAGDEFFSKMIAMLIRDIEEERIRDRLKLQILQMLIEVKSKKPQNC